MFAECCVFDKQSQRPGYCDPSQLSYACSHQKGRTFSRSYGAILPSSFTRVLSSALGFSPCLPVSVYGTVSLQLKLSGFSWKRSISHFAQKGSSRCSVYVIPDLPKITTYRLSPGQPTPGRPNFLRPHIALQTSAGILTGFPSTTHFCLALGADSPYADERCVGNLALSARGLFTPFNATHVSIRTSDTSSRPHDPPSQAYRTLSYHLQ